MTPAGASTVWVGIDPGATTTGLVVRRGDDLLGHLLVTRTVDEAVNPGNRGIPVGPHYGQQLAAAVRTAILQAHDVTGGAAPVHVAVEDLTAPAGRVRGQVQFARPVDLMAAAKALAYIELAAHESPLCELVRVPADRNGRNWLSQYPPALVTARERAKGVNRPAEHNADINHCRSAWDVAGAGPAFARLAAAQHIHRTRRASTGGTP
jgi:hypothetical protein